MRLCDGMRKWLFLNDSNCSPTRWNQPRRDLFLPRAPGIFVPAAGKTGYLPFIRQTSFWKNGAGKEQNGFFVLKEFVDSAADAAASTGIPDECIAPGGQRIPVV